MSILLALYVLLATFGALVAVAMIGVQVYGRIMDRRYHQSVIHARLWHGFKR